ncbi:MAG: hypothetical protein QM270_02060 [Bacillota bacterium]|nr:hypothetical protein [Bacillota bacterium]
MPWADFELQLRAARLRTADRREDLAFAALYGRAVRQVGPNNRYLIQSPHDLIDVSAIEREVLGEGMLSEVYDDLLQRAKRVREYHRRKEARNGNTD